MLKNQDPLELAPYQNCVVINCMPKATLWKAIYVVIAHNSHCSGLHCLSIVTANLIIDVKKKAVKNLVVTCDHEQDKFNIVDGSMVECLATIRSQRHQSVVNDTVEFSSDYTTVSRLSPNEHLSFTNRCIAPCLGLDFNGSNHWNRRFRGVAKINYSIVQGSQ